MLKKNINLKSWDTRKEPKPVTEAWKNTEKYKRYDLVYAFLFMWLFYLSHAVHYLDSVDKPKAKP